MQIDFNQFLWGLNEGPSATKLNNVLYVLERMRQIFGPFTFDVVGIGQASGVTLKLTDAGFDGASMGFYYTSGPDYILSRVFGVEYRSDAGTNMGYVRWENVSGIWDQTLDGGVGAFAIKLSGANIAYSTNGTTRNQGIGPGAGKINLTGSTADNFTVFSMNDQ